MQNYSAKSEIRMNLEKVNKKGVTLYLDGALASPTKIACQCVRENLQYMADYVLDDEGVLKEVRYDRISCIS